MSQAGSTGALGLVFHHIWMNHDVSSADGLRRLQRWLVTTIDDCPPPVSLEISILFTLSCLSHKPFIEMMWRLPLLILNLPIRRVTCH